MPTMKYKLVDLDGQVVRECKIGRIHFGGSKHISNVHLVIGIAPSGYDVYLVEPASTNGNFVHGKAISDRKVGGNKRAHAAQATQAGERASADDERYGGAVLFLADPEIAQIRFGSPDSGIGICLRGRDADEKERIEGFDRVLYLARVGITQPDLVEEPPWLQAPGWQSNDTLMGERLGSQPPSPPKQT